MYIKTIAFTISEISISKISKLWSINYCSSCSDTVWFAYEFSVYDAIRIDFREKQGIGRYRYEFIITTLLFYHYHVVCGHKTIISNVVHS